VEVLLSASKEESSSIILRVESVQKRGHVGETDCACIIRRDAELMEGMSTREDNDVGDTSYCLFDG